MINQFIKKLSIRDKFIFLSGKFFLRIASQILTYKNFKLWQLHYNKLEWEQAKVSFDGLELHYNFKNINVIARKSSSDYQVFETVILEEEYRLATDIFLLNNIPLKNFLDLGSNIGLTTLYIKNLFPDANVIALEPDKANYDMMLRNFELNHLSNTTPLMAGISNKDSFLVTNGGIRDNKDWSKTFKEVDYPTDITSFSIASILKKYNMDEIDFIKIDIEGAERNVFEKGADLSFLDIVKVIAIEIHDEFNIRSTIYKVLKEKDFILFNNKETTIAVKSNIFKNL